MNGVKEASGRRLSSILGSQFLTGVAVVVPIGVTILILLWIFNAIDGVLQPIISSIWGRPIMGVGFGITVVAIYLLGVLASSVLGGRLIRYGESLLTRVPVFRYPYSGLKRITDSFSTSGKSGFMQVVIVEFPRKGMNAIGLITSESSEASGNRLVNVFIPGAPNPTSGFMQIMSEDEIIRTNISIEKALEMLISAGKVSPPEVSDILSAHQSR